MIGKSESGLWENSQNPDMGSDNVGEGITVTGCISLVASLCVCAHTWLSVNKGGRVGETRLGQQKDRGVCVFI